MCVFIDLCMYFVKWLLGCFFVHIKKLFILKGYYVSADAPKSLVKIISELSQGGDTDEMFVAVAFVVETAY